MSKKPVSQLLLSPPELDAKVEEYKAIQQNHVLEQGRFLANVKDRTGKGGWGKFCKRIGITRRNADSYVFIARSEYAEQIQQLGIRKALLLARDPAVAEKLLKDPVKLETMSVRQLQEAIGTTAHKAARERVGQQPAAYRSGYQDGQTTDVHIARLLGSLLVPDDVTDSATMLTIAERNYVRLKKALAGERDLQQQITDAIEALRDIMPATSKPATSVTAIGTAMPVALAN